MARHLLFLLLIAGMGALAAQQQMQRYQGFARPPEQAPDSLYQALHLAQGEGRLRQMEALAQEYDRLGTTDSVIHYGDLLRRSLVPMELSRDTQRHYRSRALAILGRGKLKKGVHDAALKDFLEGLQLISPTEWPQLYLTHKLGLGGAYAQRNEVGKAEAQFRDVVQGSQDPYFLARAHTALGDVARHDNRWEDAQRHYGDAQPHLDPERDPKTVLRHQLGLGHLAEHRGQTEAALKAYTTAMEQALKAGFYDLHINAILNIGRLYVDTEEFQAAEAVLSTAYLNALSWNRLQLQQRVLEELRRLYYTMGDYQNAHNLMTQYVGVTNQIQESQNRAAVAELEVQYQTLQKEKEIFQLKEEQLLKEGEIVRQKTIKNAILIGFLILLVPIFALLYLYYQKLQAQSLLNKKQEEVNDQKVRALLREQELELVRASAVAQNEERTRIAMELHDSIGGNLAGIKLQMANWDGSGERHTRLLGQVNDTYEQVRNISHNLMPKKFKENSFTHLLQHYLDNLDTAVEQNIHFVPYPKKAINALEEALKVDIFRVIQELLTNALKYAEAQQIDIYLNRHEDQLQLICEDNGKGFDPAVTGGIGLENIKRRLAEIKGQMHVDTAPGRGTAITIEIPL
ncbi:ATP-binding protein [Maribacter sp. 2307ULW6-5]|uniref:tetratricopeptide repeat-containing sensor histidine kinase n=1 Tax=Maribacter sp. 2307ULW6-5 TaxID=3386275 RepID=UPI0039BCF39C